MSDNRGFIVAFAGQKGGSGKSTIAENVAVGLKEEGADTIIIDCDHDQRTSSKWVARRNEAIEEGAKLGPIHIAVQADNIKQGIADAAKRYDAVVVDVAGRDGRALRTAFLVADLIYVPVRPSQNDLETLEAVQEIIEDTEDLNPNRVIRFLLSMCPTNNLVSERGDAEDFLSQYGGGLKLSNVHVSDRKVYRDAALLGKGVLECDNDKAIFEIKQLMKEINSYV